MSTTNSSPAPTNVQSVKPQQPNALMNLVINIIFPAVILNKFSSPDRLGPVWGLIVALSLPLLYGAWEFITTKHHNIVSVLGFASILLSGGLGLLQMDGVWFAVKEASIPGIIALVTLGSLKTSKPLIKAFLYNDRVINVPLVDEALKQRGTEHGFSKLMVQTTFVLALSFVVSAILNFFLAVWILTAPAGTPEFNEQLGRMTALSYPVIVIPSIAVMMIAVWMLVRGLKGLTGLEMDQILSPQATKGK